MSTINDPQARQVAVKRKATAMDRLFRVFLPLLFVIGALACWIAFLGLFEAAYMADFGDNISRKIPDAVISMMWARVLLLSAGIAACASACAIWAFGCRN